MEKIRIDVEGRLARLKKETDKDVSIFELSKIIGVSRQTLDNWRKGENLKSIEALSKMAEFFKCPIDELLIKK